MNKCSHKQKQDPIRFYVHSDSLSSSVLVSRPADDVVILLLLLLAELIQLEWPLAENNTRAGKYSLFWIKVRAP